MENPDHLQLLFARYLKKECTPEEVQLLLNHFRVTQDGGTLTDLVYQELQKPAPENLENDPQLRAMFDRVQHHVHAHIAQEALIEDNVVPIRRRWLIPVGIAASLALCFMVYYNRYAVLNYVDPIKTARISTLPGERKQITLADGTQIWLNPASSLSYPEKFRGETREMRLTGEAFFEVAHDKSHPFIVHTAKLDTRVLGTSFDLDAYADQADIKVTLLTGKVRVTAPGRKVVEITPNQQAVFNPASGNLVMADYPNAAAFLDRREGILRYKGALLLTVIKDLQRTFNITIKLDERMKNCAYVGTFRSTERVETVMKKLVLPFGAALRQNSPKVYTITGKACR